MNTFGKIISTIFALFVFFILPISYHAQKQDALIQVFVQTETQKFVDTVRHNGYLNEEMYTSFIEILDSTGNLYNVSMDHAHRITEPKLDEYGFVTDYYEYFLSTYQTEILEAVNQKNGRYSMPQGDYFSVKVCNRTDTYHDFFERFFYGTKASQFSIFATAGGKILDEVSN